MKKASPVSRIRKANIFGTRKVVVVFVWIGGETT